MKFANLHLHSTCSDAEFSPHLLPRLGKALGYKALALTDHETDAGCEIFRRSCEAEGILCISGAEFYGKVNDIRCHLAALDFDPNSPILRAFIQERCDLAYEHTFACFQTGVENGSIRDFTWQEVLDQTHPGAWFCYDTVLNAMLARHRDITGVKDVFITPEAKAAKPDYPDARTVIEAVRKADGIIALAHPGPKGILEVPTLVEWGLNGIEVDHPSITEDRLPLCLEAAEHFGLYRCGGTDHTGPMSACTGKHAIPAENGITEEEFYILKERRLG